LLAMKPWWGDESAISPFSDIIEKWTSMVSSPFSDKEPEKQISETITAKCLNTHSGADSLELRLRKAIEKPFSDSFRDVIQKSLTAKLVPLYPSYPKSPKKFVFLPEAGPLKEEAEEFHKDEVTPMALMTPDLVLQLIVSEIDHGVVSSNVAQEDNK